MSAATRSSRAPGRISLRLPIPPEPAPAGAAIMSAHNVLARMSAPTGQKAPFAEGAWPPRPSISGRKYMYLNGEGIEIFHQPAAHTDGDGIVFFRRSDVVVAGDVFETERFPVIDVARGGSVQGEIAALNRVIELAIPSIPIVSREEGTWVVPGHGRLSDQLDVVQYRDMVTIVRDRVRDLVKAGMTLEQVKATSPARGYTRRYGADAGPWTTDAFHRSGVPQPARRPGRRSHDRIARCGDRARRRGRRGGARLARMHRRQPVVSHRRRAHRRPSISPATGCRLSPKTGDTGW